MSAAYRTATVLGMDEERVVGRGEAIQARREGYGWHANALAERAGISRDTLAKVEKDVAGVKPETYAKVERALNELEHEIPGDEPRDDSLSVTFRGIYGIDEMIFKSPNQDPEVLAQAVAKILDQFRNRE